MKYISKPYKFDLKTWRKNHNVSTRKLGEITGIEHTYLFRLEQERHTASPEMATKLFKALSKFEWDSKSQILTNFVDILETINHK